MQKRIEAKVHPLAALFPMMTEDELHELADDIKENSQQNPILFDPDGILLDGRNRLRACEIAGIEPSSEVYSGDPVALIISLNVKRRHMTKGQQAMAVAFAYPEPEKGRGKKDEAKKHAETAPFSYRRVQQARQVLHHSRALAEAVLAGPPYSLDKALAEVEASALMPTATKMARLVKEAPDLAARVDDGLDVDEAIAALNERLNREKAHRGNLFSGLSKVIFVHEMLGSDANVAHVVAELRSHTKEFEMSERHSTERLVDACEKLPAFLGLLKRGLQKTAGGNGDEE